MQVTKKKAKQRAAGIQFRTGEEVNFLTEICSIALQSYWSDFVNLFTLTAIIRRRDHEMSNS